MGRKLIGRQVEGKDQNKPYKQTFLLDVQVGTPASSPRQFRRHILPLMRKKKEQKTFVRFNFTPFLKTAGPKWKNNVAPQNIVGLENTLWAGS